MKTRQQTINVLGSSVSVVLLHKRIEEKHSWIHAALRATMPVQHMVSREIIDCTK